MKVHRRKAILRGTEALIPLGPMGKQATAIVDASDSWLDTHSWYLTSKGYAATYVDRRIVRMQRMLLKPSKELLVDHINRDKLDNRRSNLRLCTNQQNQANRLKSRKNTSGYKGVYRDGKKWIARVRVNNKPILLGRFVRKTEAAKAYDKAAIKYFGEFAKLNFG